MKLSLGEFLILALALAFLGFVAWWLFVPAIGGY